MQYLVYSDGGCPSNGRGTTNMFGSFAVYELPDGISDDIHDILVEQKPKHFCSKMDIPTVAKYCGATNNIAEASTLHTAISWVVAHGLLIPGNHVHICMDSELVVRQVIGMYKTKNPHLKKLYGEIYRILAEHSKEIGVNAESLITFHHIPGTVMKKTIINH